MIDNRKPLSGADFFFVQVLVHPPTCHEKMPAQGQKMLVRPGTCLLFWGTSASVPGGPPSVDFAIDSGVGMGIVYILSILIR